MDREQQADEPRSSQQAEQAQQEGLLTQDVTQALNLGPEAVSQELSPVDRAPVDEIDWDVPTDMDWDALVSNTDQGFGGLGLEQAKQQGLVDDFPGE